MVKQLLSILLLLSFKYDPVYAHNDRLMLSREKKELPNIVSKKTMIIALAKILGGAAILITGTASFLIIHYDEDVQSDKGAQDNFDIVLTMFQINAGTSMLTGSVLLFSGCRDIYMENKYKPLFIKRFLQLWQYCR